MHRTDIDIVVPCPLARDGLQGTSPVLWCPTCRKSVHNLSELGPEAAESLVGRGSVCVRAHYRPDGTVAFRHRRSGRVALRAGLALAMTTTVPAIASVSTEPGEVGLLAWIWNAAEPTLPPPEPPICEQEEAEAANPVEVEAPEPSNPPDNPLYKPIGRRDPFSDVFGTEVVGGGLPWSGPDVYPFSREPGDWPPGVPIPLHAVERR